MGCVRKTLSEWTDEGVDLTPAELRGRVRQTPKMEADVRVLAARMDRLRRDFPELAATVDLSAGAKAAVRAVGSYHLGGGGSQELS